MQREPLGHLLAVLWPVIDLGKLLLSQRVGLLLQQLTEQLRLTWLRQLLSLS
jgi:hypothetical protein